MENLLDQAIINTQKLNRLEFVHSMRCDFATMQQLFEVATMRGIEHTQWIGCMYLWLTLDMLSNHQVTLQLGEVTYDNLSQLADYMGVAKELKGRICINKQML